MIVQTIVKRHTYHDSLTLMRLHGELLKQTGVRDAVIMMGTDENKRRVVNPLLLTDELGDAEPNDLVLVIAAETEKQLAEAASFAAEQLASGLKRQASAMEMRVRTLDSALQVQPHSNLVVLSIPGRYVRKEALRALDAGLSLFIFSDNVPLEVELELKETAMQRGLFVMGPDCGTAIVGGAALGFANAVRRGRIGLVGASGTGLQEVSCLIHHLGQGVSHAIGTGSHDVDEQIGGITMIQGLSQLEKDPATEVIVIVSKPPARTVVERVKGVAEMAHKPVVMNFLGADLTHAVDGGTFTTTLEATAVRAVSILTAEPEGRVRANLLAEVGDLRAAATRVAGDLLPTQKYVRGLFSGGTFATEAAMILSELTGDIYSNCRINQAMALPDPEQSVAHTCVDLGADTFTTGRPHPMLEPRMRRERVLKEAEDPETAVLLFDVVIGYGAHMDPAGQLARYVREARALAESEGRRLPVVASVCGVPDDPQDRHIQIKTLRDTGVMVMPSNALATRVAALIAGLDVTL